MPLDATSSFLENMSSQMSLLS